MSSNFKPTKVTPEKFEAIKKAMAKTGMTRSQLGRQFNVGKTTLQTISKCNVYEDYTHELWLQRQSKQHQKNYEDLMETAKKHREAHESNQTADATAKGQVTHKKGKCDGYVGKDGKMYVITHNYPHFDVAADFHAHYHRSLGELLVNAFYDVCVAMVVIGLIFLLLAAIAR